MARHGRGNTSYLVSPDGISRRKFLRGAAAATGAFALGGLRPVFSQSTLPLPHMSGIEHIVVLMMENRSFDHFLGWLEGANGRQAGLTYYDAAGSAHRTYRLAPDDFQGCGRRDPDHSYEGGRIEYNNGACDGWLRAENDDYAIGYYTKKDLPFLGAAATRWTTCDRYFSAIMAGTFPNRIYQHAAQTDRTSNTFDLCTLPTIWDQLASEGLDGRYYFGDVPFLGLWGLKYLPISRPFSEFLSDAAEGTLPHVSFIDPRFLGEQLGVSNDDHPAADIRNGEVFLSQVYHAITTSPAWPQTVFIINFDEWGGFFDHVPPTTGPIPDDERRAVNTDGLRGFRTPCVVISPFARREAIASLELDHTSVLRMIEWRWRLKPLTVRDGTANNLAEVLDFSAPNVRAKPIDVTGLYGLPCATGPTGSGDFEGLLELVLASGWPL
jgi:phospholipase C